MFKIKNLKIVLYYSNFFLFLSPEIFFFLNVFIGLLLKSEEKKKSSAADLCFVTGNSLFQPCSLSLSSDTLEL